MDNLPVPAYQPGAVSGQNQSGAVVGYDALGSGDIRLPRMRFGQYMSAAVKRKLVEFGSIYVSKSQDDPDAVTLGEATQGDDSKPVRFYVLGVRPGWSYTDPQKKLGRTRPDPRTGIAPYPNLSLVKDNDPANVRRTYDFTISVPDYPALPVLFLLHSKWGGQAATQLNTDIKLSQQQGIDPGHVAYQVTARQTSSDSGEFAGAIVGRAKVSAKQEQADRAIVESHRELLGSGVNIIVDEEGDEQAGPVDAPPLD